MGADGGHAIDEQHLDSWLRGIVRDVSLDSLALVYDAAADLAVQPTLEMLISAPQIDE